MDRSTCSTRANRSCWSAASTPTTTACSASRCCGANSSSTRTSRWTSWATSTNLSPRQIASKWRSRRSRPDTSSNYPFSVCTDTLHTLMTSGQRIFDERPHRRGGFFTIYFDTKRCSRLQQSRCHAVIEDWMIPFAAYTAAEIPSALKWAGHPKVTPFFGDLNSI